MYYDEYGIDNNEDYPYAYGLKGLRACFFKSGKRSKRLSGCAALCAGQLIAPFIMEGYFDKLVFEAYVQQILVPELRPGQTVIMDNASFHKSALALKMIEDAGCFLLFLPTYSPDFNPIEHAWFPLKNSIRKVLPQFDGDIFQAAQNVFQINYNGEAA